LALIVATSACLPSAAVAAKAKGPAALLSLGGSGGYRIRVLATRKGSLLVAARRHASATYLAAGGGVTSTGIDADFGPFGRVEVSFRSTDGCSGYFVGTIAFRGERGYTRVDARRATGVYAPYPGACQADRRRADFVSMSVASGRSAGRARCVRMNSLRRWGYVRFQAGQGAFAEMKDTLFPDELGIDRLAGPGTPFSAGTIEHRRGVTILRSVIAKGPPSSLEFGEDPRRVTLTPPAPFSGYGKARGDREASLRIQGTLRVSFPGRPNIALTAKRPFLTAVELPAARACSRPT
jgi:hypothetical protein